MFIYTYISLSHTNQQFCHSLKPIRIPIMVLSHLTNGLIFIFSGSLTTRPNYQQFSGTVQVLKAVNDHLVLNFCQEAMAGRPAQLYSVLFSRNPGELNRWEIDSVHGLLQNKKLSVASRRMVCGNSADVVAYSFGLSILMCVFAYFIGSS